MHTVLHPKLNTEDYRRQAKAFFETQLPAYKNDNPYWERVSGGEIPTTCEIKSIGISIPGQNSKVEAEKDELPFIAYNKVVGAIQLQIDSDLPDYFKNQLHRPDMLSITLENFTNNCGVRAITSAQPWRYTFFKKVFLEVVEEYIRACGFSLIIGSDRMSGVVYQYLKECGEEWVYQEDIVLNTRSGNQLVLFWKDISKKKKHNWLEYPLAQQAAQT